MEEHISNALQAVEGGTHFNYLKTGFCGLPVFETFSVKMPAASSYKSMIPRRMRGRMAMFH